MSVRILELTKNSEMESLSIDEQIRVVGGQSDTSKWDPKLQKELYGQSLRKYAEGDFTISSSGDTVSFTDSRNNLLLSTFVIKDNNVSLSYYH